LLDNFDSELFPFFCQVIKSMFRTLSRVWLARRFGALQRRCVNDISSPPPMSFVSDVRVLDLSRILAGPWATQLLADFGADVIKVERPGHGDDTRLWGPPFVDSGLPNAPMAAYFTCANRGKRSVVINLQHKQAPELVLDLVARSDIVFENFLPGTLARLGIDYETLRKRNPRIVLVSITGFGQVPRNIRRGDCTLTDE
jgi:crotonobetainyl-CoA:carnitine CoA-transferase CaiB-like acyl-CoA transferase